MLVSSSGDGSIVGGSKACRCTVPLPAKWASRRDARDRNEIRSDDVAAGRHEVTNKDGEIDLAEFKVIMRAGPKKAADGAIGGAVDAGVGATVGGVKAIGDGAVFVGKATVSGVKATGGFVVIGLEKTFDTLGVTQGFQAAFAEDIDKSDAGLEAAFVKVDTDKSGKINAEEMKAYILSVYEKAVDDKTIGEMMRAADTNQDGEIDLAEFKIIMGAGPNKM